MLSYLSNWPAKRWEGGCLPSILSKAEPQSGGTSPETKEVCYQMHVGILGVAHEAERLHETP